MKIPRSVSTLPVLIATFATALFTGRPALATDIVKADNTTALNLTGSYVGGVIPGTGDRIQISSVLTAARSVALGANLSIDGIVFDSTSTKVLTISGSNVLTLGASGISLSASGAGAGLTFNGPAISLGATQTWDLGARGLTINGGTTIADNGNALTISTTGGQIFFHNTTAMSLNAVINGTVALTLDSTATDLTLTNASSSFTGGFAISAGNVVTGSTMSVLANSGSSSLGSGQIQLKGGTFKYSGNTATSAQNVLIDSRFVGTVEVTTAGQTLTLSNLKNTNSANASLLPNGAILGGAGNLTITNIIADSTASQKTAFTITKFGTGTLTLNAVNTYTGATTINAGTLALGASGSISTSSAITVAAGATFDTSAKSSYAFNTANATTVGVGATTAGLINSAAVTFSSASLVLDFGSTSTLLSSYNILTKTGFTGDFSNVTATGTSISGSFTFTNNMTKDWTLTSGGYDLTFSESLGTLTVTAVPEPSTYAAIFGALALAGTAFSRRRLKKNS